MKYSPGFAGRCPKAEVVKATQPLTSTLFDPAILPGIPGNGPVSNRGNEPIHLLFGTSFRSRFQIGNMGGHGASQGQEDGGSGLMENG